MKTVSVALRCEVTVLRVLELDTAIVTRLIAFIKENQGTLLALYPSMQILRSMLSSKKSNSLLMKARLYDEIEVILKEAEKVSVNNFTIALHAAVINF